MFIFSRNCDLKSHIHSDYFFLWNVCLTPVMVSFAFPDTEWTKWGILHREIRVPAPDSALPVLHHPAVAFPPHPLLFLPGPPHLQPPHVPLSSSRLPSSRFRKSPEEAGAHHRGRVPGLVPVPGAIRLEHEASTNKRPLLKLSDLQPYKWDTENRHVMMMMLYCELGKKRKCFELSFLMF